jgi:predicted GIY-YIG superfamily endonuclease
MFYAYILQSELDPKRYDIGSTADLKERLIEHNRGKCSHTAKYGPWGIKTYLAFQEKETAQRFERYLKTGSGREFARRHFE